MTNKIGLYLHIPFCVRKCSYCDFLSAPAPPHKQAEYVACIKKEIAAYRGRGYEADTVFFGGGTPSLLSAEWMEELLEELHRSFFIADSAEITVECNPETVDEGKLSAMKRAGVSRISFGLQSASDRELLLLGRIHSYARFLEAFRSAENAGFDNINVDLMSAIPGQTEASWEETLSKVISLRPAHISAYSLIIEEGTPFFDRQGELALPDEDAERRMYYRTEKLLSQAGYKRYEISNYAKPSRECRHNLKYWTGGEYLGIGLGASSFFAGARYHNPANMAEYSAACEDLAALKREEEFLTKKQRMEEFCFLGLRLTDGISREEFFRRFGLPIEEVYGEALDKYLSLGLLEKNGDGIALTARGIDVSNQVFLGFLLE